MRINKKVNLDLFKKVKRIHFIGIGGIGMSAVAKVLQSMGFKIQGSDLLDSSNTNEIKKKGAKIFIGHQASNINQADVVVTTSVISPANSEILAAREQKIPIIKRAEMLAELMRLRFGIAVAGTHGKTTTTSLISSVLFDAKLSPTAVIGGEWFGINSNASFGKSAYLVCEADESDGSFLKLSPVISVVTNIDFDHMDYFKTEENQISYFLDFINKTPFYGKNILCFDNPYLVALENQIKKPYLSYGIENQKANIKAKEIRYVDDKMSYEVFLNKKSLGDFELRMIGEHNVLNSLAAIGVAYELGIPMKKVKASLSHFMGISRRMSFLGTWNQFKVIDDYGHHPTEIKVTINALVKKTNHLICIFQPHRYTRTLAHFDDFAKSFEKIQTLYLVDIYSAGEEPIKDVSSELIYKRIKKPKKKYYIKDQDQLITKIKENHKDEKGIILTIGAGNIYKFAQRLVNTNE